MNIYDFWKAVLGKNEIEIRKYFQNDAYINWHCTNEQFDVDEFIIANCEYPGDWEGSVERVETLNDLIVTVVNVYPKGRNASFHVTSFIKTKEDKIVSMDEYWADDGNAPQWRLDKHIGKTKKIILKKELSYKFQFIEPALSEKPSESADCFTQPPGAYSQ